MTKHFIHLSDFSRQEISHIFQLADRLKTAGETDKLLEGKTIVLFVPESSIRTRVSFEKGIHMLGGETILFPPSVLDKKEDIRDVVGYLENWADMAVIRHKDLPLLERMAEYAHIPVVNAMTSVNHPCEILSDLYSLSKKYADYCEKKYLFVGAEGNVGNTWKEASDLLGFSLMQCCPKGYEIPGADVCHDLGQAVVGRDIVCTDSVPPAAGDAFKEYQVTLKHLGRANPGACLNPCPPFFRGGEVSADVIQSAYFVGYEFKKSLLEVQQAVVCYLLRGERELSNYGEYTDEH